MLILKELRLKGIGRFVEEQTVSLDRLGNLIQVDGKNNNTGGSSGAAKSTIFNALDFLFGINSIPNTVLQSRLTEEPISVEGDFDLDGQALTISRGKKLKIILDGEVTTGSAKITEEKLDQILSIPRQLFRPMLHKKQGEKGFFLNFTPKETNDFLTDCLGLGHFKKRLVDLDAKLLDISKSKESLVTSVEAAKAALNASQTALAALGELPAKEVNQELILKLKNKSDASSEQVKKLVEEYKKEAADHMASVTVLPYVPYDASKKREYERALASLGTQRSERLLHYKDKQNELQEKIHNLRIKQAELLQKIEQGASAKDDALKCAAEIKKVRDHVCPKCEQPWITDSVKDEEMRLLSEVNRLKLAIVGGENAVPQLQATKEEMDYLQSNPIFDGPPNDIEKLTAKEKELHALINEEIIAEGDHFKLHNIKAVEHKNTFDKRYMEMKDRHNKELSRVTGQADLDRRALEMAAMKLRSYEEARIRHENTSNALKSQIQMNEEKVSNVSLELDKIGKSLEFTEELKRAVKSYLSCSFDEALDAIGENATRLVRNIPNMANATIQLMGIRETKEGKLKEEVNALLHLEGDENIDIRSLSGGERASIDLAIDLSVIDLIESKTNKGINVFILDEPFTGLDSQNIEMALEMLKSANLDKKLIVVDHNPIVKEQISDRITVIRTGDTSVIEGR